VRLGGDETLAAMVEVPMGVSVEIDGAGRTITLSDYGFHVNDGKLCLHDVELTGGRNVPALVVLGEATVANASHVRISNCATYTDLDEILGNLISALDGCGIVKDAFAKIPSLLLPTVCGFVPAYAKQCCDPSKKGPKADLRVVGNLGAGMAMQIATVCSLGFAARTDRVGLIGTLSSGCQLSGHVQVCCWTKGSYPWWRVTSTEIR
jgi:hypothetical protein